MIYVETPALRRGNINSYSLNWAAYNDLKKKKKKRGGESFCRGKPDKHYLNRGVKVYRENRDYAMSP